MEKWENGSEMWTEGVKVNNERKIIRFFLLFVN